MRVHYKHWDYWLSSFVMWGLMYALTFEIIYAWNHGSDCFTGRQIMAGLGIFSGTAILAFVAVGWNVFVSEKYDHQQPTKPNPQAQVRG